ncbi:MAG TPA: type II toxin-antitoxin system RelE/ParE family toxin [Phycisphaerae bacterium]|nr:type II toxin-antitoxin system RelE/ParE family toxin [Phycisphaerae bacterium]
MKIEYADPKLERLERERDFTAGFAEAIVRAFRQRIAFIRAAKDERDFYAMKSWHFEKYKDRQPPEWSIRLNDQYRLFAAFRKEAGGNVVIVLRVCDPH